MEIKSIPISQLKPNPWNRTVFDPQALDELAASIKASGVEEPLIVRKVSEQQFEIASGNRRWLAAQKAGLAEVPCLVRELSDEQVAAANITLNVQRESLPPLEMARMVNDYITRFGLTQEKAAQTFGKKRTWATDLVGYLPLAKELEGYVGAPTLGWDQLRALKSSSAEARSKVIKELKDGTLRAEKVEKRCNQLRFGKNAPGSRLKPPQDPLAELWPLLTTQAATVGRPWGVTYGSHALPNIKGASMPTWHFWVPNAGTAPRDDLKDWFKQMVNALDNATPSPSPAPSPQRGEGIFGMPSSSDEFEQLEAEQKNPRFPKNDKEQAEVEALASQGPAAVYAWIYGPNSLSAKRMVGTTWEEIGETTAVRGCRNLIQGLRQAGEILDIK